MAPTRVKAIMKSAIEAFFLLVWHAEDSNCGKNNVSAPSIDDHLKSPASRVGAADFVGLRFCRAVRHGL